MPEGSRVALSLHLHLRCADIAPKQVFGAAASGRDGHDPLERCAGEAIPPPEGQVTSLPYVQYQYLNDVVYTMTTAAGAARRTPSCTSRCILVEVFVSAEEVEHARHTDRPLRNDANATGSAHPPELLTLCCAGARTTTVHVRANKFTTRTSARRAQSVTTTKVRSGTPSLILMPSHLFW